MKILRWLIAIIFALIVLAAIVVVLLVNFINPNDYREKINQTISDKIHKPFAIQGDISWVFFPSLGFKAQDMIIGDKQVKKDLYAQLKILEINLQILPLLHKEIALNALEVDGLNLLLPADSASTSGTSNNASGKNANPAAALVALPQLSLSNFSIKNADIAKQDLDGKTAWAIKNLSLESSNLMLDHKFPVKVNFNFIDGASNIAADINFNTDLKWDSAKQVITLTEPKLTVNNDKNSAYPGQLVFAVKNVDLDLVNQMAAIDNFSGNFNELDFSGNAKITNLKDAPLAAGQINLESSNLKNVLNGLNVSLPKMQSATALSQFNLETDFQYGNNQLKLLPLKIKLDDITANGAVQINDLKNLAMNLALQISDINLANYLAPTAEPRTVTLASSKVNLTLLPPAGNDKNWLASTATGTVSSNGFTYNEQKFNNITLQLDAKDQIFKLINFHTDAWQGKIDGNALVNMQGSTPKFSINPSVQNVQIEQVMQLVEPKFKITGVASLNGNISVEGGDSATIMKNLNGNLKVLVKHGVLHGFNLGYWLDVGSALLQKQAPPANKGANQTPFGTLTASLAINNGVVNNQDLLVQGPVGQIKGAGNADLVREALDYHLQLAKTNQATGKAHSDIIPILITGSFDNPSIRPDMAALTSQIVNKQLNKQADKIAQKVIGGKLSDSQLGQQLSGALGKLLG